KETNSLAPMPEGRLHTRARRSCLRRLGKMGAESKVLRSGSGTRQVLAVSMAGLFCFSRAYPYSVLCTSRRVGNIERLLCQDDSCFLGEKYGDSMGVIRGHCAELSGISSRPST